MNDVASIADQSQRERALDPRYSFIVQAPAGSGKTELLVRRFLKLLGTVEKPESIVAVTFTRKAAAEMRRRVLQELTDPDAVAHRLRIQTIDALCASLTRQMPVLSRFGAQLETVEDARELYQEAARRTLGLLEERHEAAAHVARLLRHLDGDAGTAQALLAGMLARRDQWLRKTGAAPTREELEAALKAERKRLIARARALFPSSPRRGGAEGAGVVDLETLARELLTKERAWRKRNKQAQALSDNEPLRLALVALLSMPPEKYSDAQWEALEAILQLLPVAAAQLKVVFAERGEADFTEIAQGAVRALGTPEEPTDLLLSMDARVQHVLVDEFQDTSISQWELLERLTAGWQADDGRTLFLVGDPMQSIYRFREAEVALFLHARREGLGSVKLEPLTLTTNFRSQAGVVEWVNQVFPRVMPAQEDETSGSVPYSPSTPFHPALSGESASWHLFAERVDEARRTARLAKEAQGTCAILVRNRNHLDEIVPALKDAGLRFRAIEIEQLGEKQAVQDLYALTRALLHLADRVAWLAVLRAPWCGLLLADLSVLAEEDRERTVWELMNDDRVVCQLSEDGRKRLVRVWEPIGQSLIQRSRGTLRDRVEGLWLALGGPACVEARTDLADAEIYLDELEKLEEAGDIQDPGLLDEALESLYALPDLEADERLQIMTIHKAKGLEFDTVIVPGLDRTPRVGERPLFAWKASPSALLLAPINETGTDKDPLYNYVRDVEKEAEDTEAGRLLYVAATRAKQRVHLLGRVKLDEEGMPKAPNRRSLLAKVWPEAAGRFALAVPLLSEERSPRSGGGGGDVLKRLPVTWTPPACPDPVRWTAPPEGRDAEEQIEFSWVGETARHVGTVVHRWLQRIAQDELAGWDAARVGSLRPRFERELSRRGVQTPGPAADLVVQALANALADERGRWLLGSHPEARGEYRIRTPGRSYVIDRVFRDEDGVRWVVDYKTSRHDGAEVEAFLDRERERYSAQLEAYAAALGGARPGLYFPLHAGWRTWTP